MQENLKIYSTAGKPLLERDLSGDRRPMMVVAGGEVPVLADTVEKGADVIGALVPDEDGWTLASSKADMPVSSGPKTAPDMHLMAGVACALGPWIFRIEREGSADGDVLLWRVGSSAVAADPIVQGRNAVAESDGGAYAVNPAVPGAELCEIFPTNDGIDVVTGESRRLSVPYATLFSVGPFQGMVLKAEDAAAAAKCGNPFAWPSRGVRCALMLGLVAIGAVALAAVALSRMAATVDDSVAARSGAVRIDRPYAEDGVQHAHTDEDVFVYQLACFSTFPSILKADPSPVTMDLIRRGEQLLGHIRGTDAAATERDVRDTIRFLRDVDAIQRAVRKGDWKRLKDTLAGSDHEMFLKCDADRFYDDAKEIMDLVMVELPAFLAAAAERGAGGFAESKERLGKYFDGMSDNLFMSGETVRRERDLAHERWETLSAFVPARDRFVSGQSRDGDGLAAAWADFVDVFDLSEASFAPMVKRERDLIEEALVRRAETADDSALIKLLEIGEAIGVDDSRLAKWRDRAAAARKEISAKYRSLYSEYRLRAAVSPGAPETVAVLDEMLKLGVCDNPFHKWAVREVERTSSMGAVGENGVKANGKESGK